MKNSNQTNGDSEIDFWGYVIIGGAVLLGAAGALFLLLDKLGSF